MDWDADKMHESETFSDGLMRWTVPGGWIYETGAVSEDIGTVFVPDPAPTAAAMQTLARLEQMEMVKAQDADAQRA